MQLYLEREPKFGVTKGRIVARITMKTPIPSKKGDIEGIFLFLISSMEDHINNTIKVMLSSD